MDRRRHDRAAKGFTRIRIKAHKDLPVLRDLFALGPTTSLKSPLLISQRQRNVQTCSPFRISLTKMGHPRFSVTWGLLAHTEWGDYS